MTHRYLDFLGELERAESTLLGWGLVDGYFSEDEVRRKAGEFLDRHQAWGEFSGEDDLIEQLASRQLLFGWFEGGQRYRTRMAETVRLMARLRQLFPRHFRNPGGWGASPTLVSDFRFLLRAREYPRRDLQPQRVINDVFSKATRLSPLQTRVLSGLLHMEENSGGIPLAGFQVRATERILKEGGNSFSTGTVVCAGTGSGKTWAFYLPALTRLVGMLENESSNWTRAIALYPRNELLKDQLTETVRQTRRLKPILQAAGIRPIRVGTFFGPTPKRAAEVVEPEFGEPWERWDRGRICPFLVCPECSGPLLWQDTDRERNIERLICSVGHPALESNDVVLTRERIAREPADILFTTTEMMNQRMTDSRHWHLFGIGKPSHRKPVLVLLDEAHTYSGSHGAQVAYLLRRWKHRSQARPQFVGLSATLLEATAFFAQLTGLSPSVVEEVSPERAEMQQEGMEYMLALRGDPVSGASLLSTTIQSGMLLRRILNTKGDFSDFTYGKKAFLFTDDLDVTNRMFFNLLDAEGMDSKGRPDPRRHPTGSLATLRATSLDDEERRFLQGQSWRMCEEIGHDLSDGSYLRIGRVSSQDSGVDAAADIIVATASLEVGFNDPEVGAVLQHKAPRDAASFLQRKGRAGRNRQMRPWTLVILSDFGRDRLAYQGYDLLFDPELRPKILPMANRHVQKMQAVYACMDWLSSELTRTAEGWFWNNASRPAGDISSVRRRQEVAAEIIRGVLAGGEEMDRLREWLGNSLKLGEKEIQAVLWEAPRALMTAALPTLERRLASQWMYRDKVGQEYFAKNHPLPEFVPANLFSDLTLPEVQIWASLGPNRNPEAFAMPVLNALKEFAPGRITRRFGIQHGLSRHWIPVDPTISGQQTIDVLMFCPEEDREFIGIFHYPTSEGIQAISVWRPFAIDVRSDAPSTVKDSSQAFLRWNSQILAPTEQSAGQIIDLPANSPWTDILQEIRFFTHLQFQPVQVRRFSTGSQAQLNLDQGQTVSITTQFVLTGSAEAQTPIALGYLIEADAIRVHLNFPGDWHLSMADGSKKVQALRANRFRWRVASEPSLQSSTSVFERKWIADIVLAGITANAVQHSWTLQASWTALRNGTAPLKLHEVMDVVFQAVPGEMEDGSTRFEQQRLSDLRNLLQDPMTIEALDVCIVSLWEVIGAEWATWLQERFVATAAAAFKEAVQQVCPDINGDSLQIDLHRGPDASGILTKAEAVAEFWLTEGTPGGGGIIEHLLPKIAEAPRRFLDLWHASLKESDFEHADHELRRLLDWIVFNNDVTISTEIRNIRNAGSLEETSRAFHALQTHLQTRGLHTSHPVMTALSSRILRPGSTPSTDDLVVRLMIKWDEYEARLGMEIEAQAFAFAMSQSQALEQALDLAQIPLSANQDRRIWRFNALLGLLWPRGSHARNYALAMRQTFSSFPEPERLLVTDVLGCSEPEVDFSSPDWASSCNRLLVEKERVALVTDCSLLPTLRVELMKLLARPLDTGSLLVYPRIRGIERRENKIAVILEVVTGGQISYVADDGTETTLARLIVKTTRGSRDEIRDLLESLLAIELLAPGEEIWMVSPWISDLGVLDNRSGAYSGLDAAWPKRFISLAELLVFALRANPQLRLIVVTRPDEHNLLFCDRLKFLVSLDGNDTRLTVDSGRSQLHTKGFVATNFALNGSMNFTRNGIEIYDETVQLEIDVARVAQFRLNLDGHYR